MRHHHTTLALAALSLSSVTLYGGARGAGKREAHELAVKQEAMNNPPPPTPPRPTQNTAEQRYHMDRRPIEKDTYADEVEAEKARERFREPEPGRGMRDNFRQLARGSNFRGVRHTKRR